MYNSGNPNSIVLNLSMSMVVKRNGMNWNFNSAMYRVAMKSGNIDNIISQMHVQGLMEMLH
jgi:hypothetical protein